MRASSVGIATCVLLMACGCAAARGAVPTEHTRTPDGRDVVVVAAEHEVCAASMVRPPPCVTVVSSGEPVLSATLARLDATAELVMVVGRSDVVIEGLGPGTARVPVRVGGREVLVWLRSVPAGTSAVCAAYRTGDGDGRVVVHRALTVTKAGVAAADLEHDDGC